MKMQGKSESSLKSLPVAPSEQTTQVKDCYTESIFQSRLSKVYNYPDRFKPIRNASFQSLSTVTDSKSINSTSSIKDFIGRQDSKIGQINVYEPLLDPGLQNSDNERPSDSDSDVETTTEEEYQGKQDSVQLADNEPDISEREEIQPNTQSVGKNKVPTNLKTSASTLTKVIKKQLTDDKYIDKMATTLKKANLANVKLTYDKFTNKCFLAKTWLKVTINTKTKQDDSRAKRKSADHIPPIRLLGLENNKNARSLKNSTDYTAKADLIKVTTPVEPSFNTPIYTSQATSEIDFSTQSLLEPSALMSSQIKDIMELCDESFYGN